MKTRIPTPKLRDILRDEFLEPLEITPYRYGAGSARFHQHRVGSDPRPSEALHRDGAETGALLWYDAARFWINLQADIEIREKQKAMEKELKKIRPVQRSA